MEQEDRNLQAQPSETQEKPEKQPLPKGYEAYLSLFDLVRMLAVITLVFVFFFRLNGVSGSSMYPTLVDKDYLVLESNFLYRDAKQGDIVVLYTPPFSENDELLVKRVIAVGGCFMGMWRAAHVRPLPRGKPAVVGVLDPSEQACARRSDTSGRPSFSSCPQYKENPPVSAAYAS